MKKLNEYWALISFVILVVFLAGGFYWNSTAQADRITKLENKQDDMAEIKTGIAVLQNDVSWIKKQYQTAKKSTGEQ